MNDKVKELVEWGHNRIPLLNCRTCQDTDKCICYGEADEGICIRAIKIVKAILSHPDLALIDREKFARHILVRTYNPGWYPVTPLAEAIKEKGEDES